MAPTNSNSTPNTITNDSSNQEDLSDIVDLSQSFSMDSNPETYVDIMTTPDCKFNSSYSHAWMKNKFSGLLDLPE